MELDAVVQPFEAQTGQFVADIELAIEAAKNFADAVHADIRALAEFQAALDSLPLEKTVTLRFNTEGAPGAVAGGAAGAAALAAETDAMRAAEEAAYSDAAAQEAAAAAMTQAGGAASFETMALRELRDMSASLDLVAATLGESQQNLAVIQRDTADSSADLMMQTALLRDAQNAAGRSIVRVDNSTRNYNRTLVSSASAAGNARGLWGFLRRDITLFGGALGSLPLLGTVTGLHLIADAAIETAAVIVPATVAFAAFGAAAVPTVQDIYRQMQAVYTTSTALGQNIYPLTGGFSAMADAVRPEVYQLFGEALVVINHDTGMLTTIAREAGAVLDQLGARAAAALTSGGMAQFLSQGPADLAKIGDIIGNLAGTVGNLLKVMPGYAEVLLQAFDDVSKGIEAVTGSQVGQWVAGAGLAFHGFVLWAGLGATAAITLGNALAGLAVKLGLAEEGTLAFDAAAFRGGIAQMAGGVKLLGTELVTLGASEDIAAAGSLTLDGAFSALAAVNPLLWIAGAVAGFAALADHVLHASNATSGYVDSAQKAMETVPVSQLGLNLSLEQVKATTDLRDAQQAMNDSTQKLTASQMLQAVAAGRLTPAQRELWQNYGDAATLSKQLAADQENYNTVLVAAGGNISLVNQAGITSNDILAANASKLRQLVIEAKAAADAQRALALGTGRSAAALNAQTNEFMTETVPALQKVTQAEDAVITVITGGRAAFDTFEQGIYTLAQNLNQATGSSQTASFTLAHLKSSASLAGAALGGTSQASYALNEAFYAQVQNGQKLIDSLQQQAISTASLRTIVATAAQQMTGFAGTNTEARSVIVSLINNALGPGTVSLQDLNTWLKHNSTSLQGMNALIAQSTIAAGTLAGTLESQLNSQFRQFLLQSSGASAALRAYTDALAHNRASTAAGQAIRAQLIRDLEMAGLSAQQAAQYVDGLAASVNSLHSKTITITTVEQAIGAVVPGAGQPGVTAPGHAAGWRVPGHGSGDIVPAMLEPGEAVVPRHLVPYVAPFLAAHHVPGFAAGGMADVHGGGHGGPPRPGLNMREVEAIWASEIVARDLRGHTRGHPLAAAAMELLLRSAAQPKHLSGLWKDPVYRGLEGMIRHDLGPYAARDLQYWRLLADEKALHHSEAVAVAHDLHEIHLHERSHQPGWVRFYERQLHGLEHADALKFAVWASELAKLTRQGFSAGGVARSYDSGGYLPVGLSMAYNGTGRPEPVGGAGRSEVHVHLHGDLADDSIWERMQVKTLDYGYQNTGRPTGVWQPGG